MATAQGSFRIVACLAGMSAGWLLCAGSAAAFPTDSPLNPSIVSVTTDLGAPDVQQLNHQMGLLSGFGSVGAGWTVLPSLSAAVGFNDNLLEAHSPRRWDVFTAIQPGIAVAGDTAHTQLRLSYQPVLQLYARTGSENSLSHQFSGTSLFTVVPDLFYVDVRGLAGVQSATGGIGGIGSIGSSNFGGFANGSLAQLSHLGVSKQNLYQSVSVAVSPYLLHQFGDIGTARVGISLDESSSSQLNGFTALPWQSGTNAQRQFSVEENASFQTGDVFSRVRDTITLNADQSYGNRGYGGSGQFGIGNSESEYFNNRIDYAWSTTLRFYGQFGWQHSNYQSQYLINGPTWEIGTTYTPDPDTSISLGYGRHDGTTSFNFDGRYAVTARTTLTGSYHNGVTTQTGLLRSQLYASSVANNGSLVNSTTGAPQFVSLNALGLTPGVFRYSDFNLGATTVLERDTISVNVSYSTRTQVGSSATGAATNAKTAGISWTHLVTPNLTLNASVYYSMGNPFTGSSSENSLAVGLSGQYTLSETVSTFARYALFERQSQTSALSMYQNLLLVGITKQF